MPAKVMPTAANTPSWRIGPTSVITTTVTTSTSKPSPKIRPNVQIDPRMAGTTDNSASLKLPMLAVKTSSRRTITIGGMASKNKPSMSITLANTTGLPAKVASTPGGISSLINLRASAIGSPSGWTAIIVDFLTACSSSPLSIPGPAATVSREQAIATAYAYTRVKWTPQARHVRHGIRD